MYEGTWLPTTIFFMNVVKLGIFFFFVRFLIFFFYPNLYFLYTTTLLISSLGSIFIGCFGSLYQQSIKRLFSYASITQVGFSFLGLCCVSFEGIISSLFFFIIYIFTSMGIFAILINSECFFKVGTLVSIVDFAKIKTNVTITIVLTIFLLSMAGIPPLAGFFTKLFIFISVLNAGYIFLFIWVIIISVINSYIYLRIIKILWSDFFVYDKKFELKKLLYSDIRLVKVPVIDRSSYSSMYSSFLTIVLILKSIFILFFFLILPDYLLFCHNLTISLTQTFNLAYRFRDFDNLQYSEIDSAIFPDLFWLNIIN